MAPIGQEEKDAVMRVLESGVLSGYLAGQLDGGPEVNALEKEWAEHFGYKHAVAMNSATSGLIAACMVAGKGRFIVSPLTMSATATAPIIAGGSVIFGDIEPDFFCLSAESVNSIIQPTDAAVIVTSLFGQAYDPAINEIAHENNILVIEDAAQRPIKGQGDIVVYSLNYHKHIHCGEGGIVCTDSDAVADELRLIRNHGECAEAPRPGLFGFNFRLTEIQAAIARVQLKKLSLVLKERQESAKLYHYLAPVRPGFEHAWYLYPHLDTLPTDGFAYKSFLPDLFVFEDTPGYYPVTSQVIERIFRWCGHDSTATNTAHG
jgi:perosamine synthetase